MSHARQSLNRVTARGGSVLGTAAVADEADAVKNRREQASPAPLSALLVGIGRALNRSADSVFSGERRAALTVRRWSADVTEHSDALDLDEGVFKKKDPAEIAASLKRSAERSHRKKGTPFQSAMSMLTFYINRAGDNLDAADRKRLEAAKDELRKLFHKEG